MLCLLTPNKERDEVRLQLYLGPGPDDIRARIVKALHASGLYKGTPTSKWTLAYKDRSHRLTKEEKQLDPDDCAKILRGTIEQFLADGAMKIAAALEQHFAPDATVLGVLNHRAQLFG